jgi:hypothetical protein
MKTPRVLLASIAFGPLLALAAPGTVEFRSADPEAFRDLRTQPAGDVAGTANLHHDLRMYTIRAAQRHIPRDSHLTITLLDVDMAGDFWPTGGFRGERRVVRLGDEPRIDLDFRLTAADGTVVREGRRELTNKNYRLHPAPGQRGALAYEKGLILHWLRQEFQ